MIKIGMILGDRYEILEKIGTGGMSDVYKAKDQKLIRNVAVKVLKQEFSENENFVSKFRVEAQAAAGLMHQNIVNVYDVGEENGINYIVMELVEGITLKKYIEKKARLTYKEAVSIAIQVGLGIEAAHNNHIIHRDIKPQNIIISMDGKVKVTDFGIAKAATSNTITSNVMGSVHYTSPEQARGGYSDEKSDIYSLGITLFEMLTGRVPFNGETTVAIAIKHIQEEMPSPREYVDEIPYCVEDIIYKCCEKSPDRRYQNMHELVDDLKQALLTPDEDFVVRVDPITDGETRAVTDEELDEIRNQTGSYGYADQEDYPGEDTMRLANDGYADDGMYNDPEDDYEYDPKMEKVTTLLAILAGIVIVAIIIILAVKLFGKTADEEPVEPDSPVISEDENKTPVKEAEYVLMPSLVGKNVDDARNALFDVGLVPKVEYQESDTVASGVVISQETPSGTQVEKGGEVTLIASSGTEGVTMPDVTGSSFEQANSTLAASGFIVNKVEEPSDTVEAGKVISQSPSAGTKVPKGSAIVVKVSSGKEDKKVKVPDFVGKTEEDAIILAIENGIKIDKIEKVHSNDQPAGNICYQNPAVGSYVDAGSSISVQVSLGPADVTYKYKINVAGPTVEETKNYESGTKTDIRLVGEDGTELLKYTTDVFPYTGGSINGIKTPKGTLTLTFEYEVETQEKETDADGNETVKTIKEKKTETITRAVEFTKE